MNIKRAKEEIRNTIEAYLLKNEYGEYEIPVMAQRPVFLIGAPGIGKTQIMEQFPGNVRWDWFLTPITHHIQTECNWTSFYFQKEF